MPQLSFIVSCLFSSSAAENLRPYVTYQELNAECGDTGEDDKETHRNASRSTRYMFSWDTDCPILGPRDGAFGYMNHVDLIIRRISL